MKLQRLHIEQIRRFREPFEIEQFAPGINVFTGPNGAGKSTIVRAIRAAFLERHRSSGVEDMRPEGDSSATPSVTLQFELNGVNCELEKSFLGRKRCLLRMGNEQLDGEEAEDRLAEILGFEFSGRGGSQQRHWGIPGLLWIEQGSGHEVNPAVGFAVNHLQSALSHSLGEVASSSGDDVLNKVQALRDELLTGTGKPKAAYAESQTAQQQLNAELAEIDRQIDAYRQQVDLLATLSVEHARDMAERPWESLREQQREAAMKLESIHQRKLQLQAERDKLKQSERQRDLLTQQLGEFARQEQQLPQREQALKAASEQLEEMQGEWARLAPRQQACQRTYDEAREALRRARDEDRRRSLVQQLSSDRQRMEQLRGSLEQAEAAQQSITALRQQLSERPVTKPNLDQLVEQERDLRELMIRAEAIATRVRYALESGQQLQLGEEILVNGGERLLLAATTLSVPGVGTLEIIPGGVDVGDLARQQDELREAHQALLVHLGFSSVVEATERFDEIEQVRRSLRDAEQALALHAPEGIAPLSAQLVDLEGRLAQTKAQIAELPPEESDALPLVVADQRVEEASKTLKALDAEVGRLQQALSRCQATCDSARSERDALAVQLQDPERQESERNLQRLLIECKTEFFSLQQHITDAEQAIAATHPEILEQDVSRLQISADTLERSFNERRNKMANLQGQLEQAGSQGLEERRADLDMRTQQAQRRVNELSRRAKALDLLTNLLQEKRRELTRRLQEPLQKHLNHYLALLFAGASVEIGEDLTVGQVSRPVARGIERTLLEQQSFGTREQLSLIARLAYADLLLEAGRPTLIILDDALVHSDTQRLGQMKRILFDAAQRHQILLFTCHPEAWRDLGAMQTSIDAA